MSLVVIIRLSRFLFSYFLVASFLFIIVSFLFLFHISVLNGRPPTVPFSPLSGPVPASLWPQILYISELSEVYSFKDAYQGDKYSAHPDLIDYGLTQSEWMSTPLMTGIALLPSPQRAAQS